MPQTYRPIDITPQQGGRLITAASLEDVGVFNYTVKRDLRRTLMGEMQREGYDLLSAVIEVANEFLVDDAGPINLIAEVVRENGHRAVIVGTPTTLYRLSALEAGGVFEEDVFEDGVFEDETISWRVIGSGYSTEGHRWEAINIAGFLWLNNGRDLCMTYRAQDPEVRPCYELREQGISHVGTIAEINGVPCACDIYHIKEEHLRELFRHNGVRYSGDVWAQVLLVGEAETGTVVESTEPFFDADDVNRVIVFDDGATATIITFTDSQHVVLGDDITAPPQPFVLKTKFTQVGSYYSEEITATQGMSQTLVTASDPVFNSGMVGATLRYPTGWETTIASYVSTTQVHTTDQAPSAYTDYPFWIIHVDAIVWDAVYLPNVDTGLIHPVTIRGAPLSEYYFIGAGVPGTADPLELYNPTDGTVHQTVVRGLALAEYLEFDAGVVAAEPDPVFFANTDMGTGHTLSLETAVGPILISAALPATNNSYIVDAASPVFSADDVGKVMFWDTGDSRTIVEYLSPISVIVDSDMSHEEGTGGIENTTSYERWDGPTGRIGNQIIWGSKPDDPQRWGVIAEATAIEGENLVSLRYPFKSFEADQSVTVVGAGANNGNFTSTVAMVTFNRVLLLADPVEGTIENFAGQAQQSDVIGSIVGYENLEYDGAAILRAMPLKGYLVIYSDSAVFTARYTGNPAKPFDFERKELPPRKSIFYRWTLVNVNSEFHLYAGKDAFYRYDLVSQIPREFESAELCKNLFFSQATLANTNRIFAVTNDVTKEVFFWYPSEITDKCLAFDYLYGTWATSVMEMTAGATIKKPVEGGIQPGESPAWFLMADRGVILLYGLSDELIEAWNAKSIAYRRGADEVYHPCTWSLRSGLESFGVRHSEKDIRSYVLHMTSDSDATPIDFELFGARNAKEVATVLTKTIAKPTEEPLVPMFYRKHYFGWSITGGELFKVVGIAGHTMEVSGVNSQSFTRRPV